MALQDRDYYRQRQKSSSAKGAGHVAYLVMPCIALALLWWSADIFLHSKYPSLTVTTLTAETDDRYHQNETTAAGTDMDKMVLTADIQGHFRGTVLINDVAMPFLIDTGATKTSIPYKLAIASNLPFGKSVKTITAGGEVQDQLTRIKSLKLGNAEIKNLDANINQHLDEVLIGMNTLKFFNMNQSGHTLTLSANKQPKQNQSASALDAASDHPAEDFMEPEKLVKKPLNLKKTVSCNEHNTCRTIYSDH